MFHAQKNASPYYFRRIRRLDLLKLHEVGAPDNVCPELTLSPV